MRKLLFVLLLLAGPAAFAQEDTSLNTILGQLKVAAKQLLIDKYYPANIDTLYGGYITTFDAEFQPTGNQEKMIVTQARNVWTTAKAAEFYHDTSYITMSTHGFYFLRDKMWDKEYGGFYSLVSRQGEPISKMKEAYGNAFGIYALAALYKASGDTAVLEFAKKAFGWLEKHSHDPVYKGYFQHLERDGTPIKRAASTPSTSDLGYKDQNSSIHILEALTELYSVWHDPLLKERLTEMLLLVRDTIVTEKGYLQLFLTPEWKPVTFRGSSKKEILAHRSLDHVSGGHDVETAYLLREASEALAIPDDVKTAQIGKKMVDHAINNVWDKKIGGLYDEGYYFTNDGPITVIADTKNWWAQAEALNTFLMFAQLYPDDRMHYLDLFKKEWNYCQTYLIDHGHGDWYEGGIDKQPGKRTARKAHIWKGPYHCFRALSNCIKRIENWGNEMPGKTE
jgi:mannobiose 2-epimerase